MTGAGRVQNVEPIVRQPDQLGVQARGQKPAALAVLGIAKLVLAHRVVEDREQDHDHRVGARLADQVQAVGGDTPPVLLAVDRLDADGREIAYRIQDGGQVQRRAH